MGDQRLGSRRNRVPPVLLLRPRKSQPQLTTDLCAPSILSASADEMGGRRTPLTHAPSIWVPHSRSPRKWRPWVGEQRLGSRWRQVPPVLLLRPRKSRPQLTTELCAPSILSASADEMGGRETSLTHVPAATATPPVRRPSAAPAQESARIPNSIRPCRESAPAHAPAVDPDRAPD